MVTHKFQFHVHTQYSSDGFLSSEKLYGALKKNGISSIAITDHNTIEGAREFEKKYGDEIFVIIGEEILSSGGEVIGLFLRETIPAGLSPRETIVRIKAQNGLVCIPHPFDDKRKDVCLSVEEIYENLADIDIIEVYNGRCYKREYNAKAIEFCKAMGKIPIWGSDSHQVFEIDHNYLTFEIPITRENFISGLALMTLTKPKLHKAIYWQKRWSHWSNRLKEVGYWELLKFIYRKGLNKR